MWGQDGRSNSYDYLLELTVEGYDGGCNGCDGFLHMFEDRTLDVLFVMIC